MLQDSLGKVVADIDVKPANHPMPHVHNFIANTATSVSVPRGPITQH